MRALETARLRLRPLGSGDEAFYCRLYGDAKVMEHIGPPLALDTARSAFARTRRLNSEAEFIYRLWVITSKQDRRDIGLLGLVRREGGAEIGAMLGDGMQGRGYAAEAIAALVDYAFMHHDLDLLFTQHRSAHGLATGLMRKLGFARLQTSDSAHCRWELTRQQWQAQLAPA